jgi:hypothetical protein
MILTLCDGQIPLSCSKEYKTNSEELGETIELELQMKNMFPGKPRTERFSFISEHLFCISKRHCMTVKAGNL